jgi:hypothetical protein
LSTCPVPEEKIFGQVNVDWHLSDWTSGFFLSRKGFKIIKTKKKQKKTTTKKYQKFWKLEAMHIKCSNAYTMNFDPDINRFVKKSRQSIGVGVRLLRSTFNFITKQHGSYKVWIHIKQTR